MISPLYQDMSDEQFEVIMRQDYTAYCKTERAPMTFEAWSLQEECKYEASGLIAP